MGIKMRAVIVLVVGTMLFAPLVISTKSRNSRFQTDALSKARCDLTCLDVSKETKAQCRSQCRTQQKKPGTCPISDSTKWAEACVEECNSDAQCDNTERCCRHGCSSSCDEPVDLKTLPGLPALPTIDEPKERKRSIVIKWSDGVGDAARAVPGRILYILEEQDHLGPKYEETRLGDWHLLLRTNKSKVSVRNQLKPGRWYRFRVAAVSAFGTRGFSEPSPPFTPRRGPRPPQAPRKLKVRPMKSDNGTMTIRLEWKEPRSDLPVVRYKVFWSRRVKGLTGELNSVLVNHQTVPKDRNYVDIKDLQPNSMYFLQVQTISQFGSGKLRSEKSAVFYNTTSTKYEHPPESLHRNEKKIKGLKLNNIVFYNHKLKARISWEPLGPMSEGRPRRYHINWRTNNCEKKRPQDKELTATTENSVFEIYELDFQCSYIVQVNRSRKPKRPDSELVVTVPACEYFQQRVNNTSLNCEKK